MNLYEYDIFDGDKGIIAANTMEEAIKIFQCEYVNTPILGRDVDDYNSGVCIIDEVGKLYDIPKLYFLHD